MNKNTITQNPQRLKRLNSYLTGLKDLYQEDIERMIYFCYEEFDATYEQIGKGLGISKQAVQQQYPKEKKEKKV